VLPFVTSYPRAKWRLATPGTLDHVAIWVSHILIRHEKSSRQGSFGLPGWNPLPPAPARTREEALERARRVAQEARAHPDEFEALARRWSEDVLTSESGGSLGGLRGADLHPDPTVLDALAALKSGEVSDVVETRHGFHVLLRQPVPALAYVAGRRIVVGYAEAKFLRGRLRPGHEHALKRSRDDALALTQTIAGQLRDGQASFETLWDRHSDLEEVTPLGDVGRWSTQESNPVPLAIERLSGTAVGGATQPIDSPLGFQLYQRTDAAPRPEYAMTVVRFPFASAAPDDHPRSRAKARTLAESVARTLVAAPDRIATFQAEYCCTGVERWTEGRKPAALSQVVSGLAPGAIAEAPVEAESSFFVVKRVDPADAPPPPATLLDLPAPETPDVMAFAKMASGTAVQRFIRQIRDEGPATLGLDEQRAGEFRQIHDAVIALFATDTGPERDRALAARILELQALLNEDEYARYDARLRDSAAVFLMRRSR
jgi:hypothetical protein